MKREEIMETIKSLASSQGLYGRLYRDLMELDEDKYDEVMTETAKNYFRRCQYDSKTKRIFKRI